MTMTTTTKMRISRRHLQLLLTSKESKAENENLRNDVGVSTIYEMPKREKRREKQPRLPLKNDSNQKINNNNFSYK